MNFMNLPAPRRGKLQLEIDQDQAARLAVVLRLVADDLGPPGPALDAANFLTWLSHRAYRRWGVTLEQPKRARRARKATNSGRINGSTGKGASGVPSTG